MKKIFILSLLFVGILYSNQSNSILDQYVNKSNCDYIIDKNVFNICYDKKTKSAKIVTYMLDGSLVNNGNIKKRQKFYTEDTIPAHIRTKTSDYTNTGYQRGHLAPDASFDYSEKALTKTYSMANIVPMSPNLNQKTWIKVEKYERLVASKLGYVNVINLVFYDKNPPIIGKKKNLFVPSLFYKILINQEQNFQRCFEYKNEMPLILNGILIDGEIKESINVDSDNLEDHIVDCKKIKGIV